MKKPVLVGMVKLGIPKIIARNEEFSEIVGQAGVSQDGELWGLVMRMTKFPGEVNMRRLMAHRWVRIEGLGFSEEVIDWQGKPPAMLGATK